MALATAAAADLDSLAHEINRAHHACEQVLADALAHAVRAGRLLADAKQQVPFGEWGTWIISNFAGSERTAQVYMQLARAGLPQRSADLSIAQALRAITAVSGQAPEQPSEPDIQDLGEQLRAAGLRGQRPATTRPSHLERQVWRDVDSALDAAGRQVRRARRRDLAVGGRAEAAANAAAAARNVAERLERLAAMFRTG